MKEDFEQQETHRRLLGLEEKVEKIMTNHLPHIEVALTKLSERMELSLTIIKTISLLTLTAISGAIFKLIIL